MFLLPMFFTHFNNVCTLFQEHLTGTDQAFVPTVDGEFLTEEPLQSLRKGNVHDLPTIVGTVSHEGFLIYNCKLKIMRVCPKIVDR